MENGKLMSKSYSRHALAAFTFLMAAMGLQIFSALVLSKVLPESLTGSSAWTFLNIIVPEYVLGFPLFLLITLKMDTKAPEKNKFGFGKFLIGLFMTAGVIGIGAAIGFPTHLLILKLEGKSLMDNMGLAGIMLGSNAFWRILTVGILAPIVEEIVFRKFLIDRTYKYGEFVAVLTSGLMFGLFHGNFTQFFFATFMGFVMAYIYIRTGKIWITIAYHMIINLTTSVITIGVFSLLDMEKISKMTELAREAMADGGQNAALMEEYTKIMAEVLPSMLLYYGWLGFLGLVILTGIIIWIVILVKKKIKFQPTEAQVEGGVKFAWGNVGMILFVVGCLAVFVINYLP